MPYIKSISATVKALVPGVGPITIIWDTDLYPGETAEEATAALIRRMGDMAKDSTQEIAVFAENVLGATVSPTAADMIETRTPEDEQGPGEDDGTFKLTDFHIYKCKEVHLSPMKKGSKDGYSYALKSEVWDVDGGFKANIVIYGGDELRKAGYPVDEWKTQAGGKSLAVKDIELPIAVEARQRFNDKHQPYWEARMIQNWDDFIPF